MLHVNEPPSNVLFFAILGGGGFATACHVWVLWRAMRSFKGWERIPAVLDTLQYQEYKNKLTGAVQNYQIMVQYHYTLAGETYTSSYVTLEDLPPRTFCRYEKDVLDTLRQIFDSTKQMHCFADPKHPEQAVLLDRPMTLHMYGSVVLSLISIAMAVSIFVQGMSPIACLLGFILAAGVFYYMARYKGYFGARPETLKQG